MRLALKTLGIYLVDVLRAGGPRREPAALCHHFQAADGSIVARSSGQLGADRLARKGGLLYRFRCEVLQLCFLLGCGGGRDPWGGWRYRLPPPLSGKVFTGFFLPGRATLFPPGR